MVTGIHRTDAEMAAVSCGTSHVTTKQCLSTLMNIQNALLVPFTWDFPEEWQRLVWGQVSEHNVNLPEAHISHTKHVVHYFLMYAQRSHCLLVICVNGCETLPILHQWYEKYIQHNLELSCRAKMME